MSSLYFEFGSHTSIGYNYINTWNFCNQFPQNKLTHYALHFSSFVTFKSLLYMGII